MTLDGASQRNLAIIARNTGRSADALERIANVLELIAGDLMEEAARNQPPVGAVPTNGQAAKIPASGERVTDKKRVIDPADVFTSGSFLDDSVPTLRDDDES